ncbi:hypothetical protein HJC23_004833 [Cyclotella cryptica]|uniref:Peroxin-13 n=1 Tax=Cyclotella cryptica TaxID=29204 RepID=A0ABD3P6Q8_9STRA|eukprot:CCRYP_017049-RA/>CCRYP_017049-RA protein AED:0.09 eAED:0.09 QI:0/-1/0/1/-1/1/1/0/345
MESQSHQPKIRNGKHVSVPTRGIKDIGKARKMAGKTTSSSSASTPTSSAIVTSKTQNQQQEKVDDEVDTTSALEQSPTTTTQQDTTHNSYGSAMGSMGLMSGAYGGGMMGMMPGMYGMGGMGMYGGMMGGMMGSQWIFSLNQFLFGIQSVVFSLGQAVQIVGMNAQQIRSVYESIKGMVENALGQVHEWGKVSSWEDVAHGMLGSRKDDARRWILGDGENSPETNDNTEGGTEQTLTENEIIRRRRLAAFRWSLTLSVSYLLYKTLRRLVRTLILGNDTSRYSRDYGSHGYYGGRPRNQYSTMPGRTGGYYHDNMNGYGGSRLGYGGRTHYDPYSQDYGGSAGYY